METKYNQKANSNNNRMNDEREINVHRSIQFCVESMMHNVDKLERFIAPYSVRKNNEVTS